MLPFVNLTPFSIKNLFKENILDEKVKALPMPLPLSSEKLKYLAPPTIQLAVPSDSNSKLKSQEDSLQNNTVIERLKGKYEMI